MSTVTAYRHRVIVSLEFSLDPERADSDRVFTTEAVKSLAEAVESDLRSNYEPALALFGAALDVDAVASITRETDDGLMRTILSDCPVLDEEV